MTRQAKCLKRHPVPLTARFKSSIGFPVIDEENGKIVGCRIATLGAVSKSAEGQGRGLKMDSETISALFKLAKDNGDRLPAFFTHDWYESDGDGLNHDAGVWNDFAIDGEGNLTATFTAFATPFKAGIFSRAKTDPNGIAVSPLFHFTARNGSKEFCDPTEFVSSDFVKSGAINKALFSETQPENKTMDINELIAALADPKVQEAVSAIIKSHKKDATAEDDSENEAPAAEMEAAAGVTDEDKKPEDTQKPALMRAAIRTARAITRQRAALAADKDALLTEVKTTAKAEATALLGKGGFQITSGVPDKDEVKEAIAAYRAAGAKSDAVAILRLAKDKPELYNAAVKAGKL